MYYVFQSFVACHLPEHCVTTTCTKTYDYQCTKCQDQGSTVENSLYWPNADRKVCEGCLYHIRNQLYHITHKMKISQKLSPSFPQPLKTIILISTVIVNKKICNLAHYMKRNLTFTYSNLLVERELVLARNLRWSVGKKLCLQRRLLQVFFQSCALRA